MFPARDTGDTAAAHRLDATEDLIFDELTGQVAAEVADHQAQEQAALTRLRTVQHDLTRRTPIAFLLGLLLTAGLLALLQRLKHDLQHRAVTDELTGLPNRAAFAAALTQRLADAADPVGVLLFDLGAAPLEGPP